MKKLFYILLNLSLFFAIVNTLHAGEYIPSPYSAHFNGNDSYLKLNAMPEVGTSDQFSIEFKLKAVTLPEVNQEFEIISGRAYTISLVTYPDSVQPGSYNSFVKFRVFSTNGLINETLEQVSLKRVLPNYWVQVCCTFDGKTPNIFINGRYFSKNDSLAIKTGLKLVHSLELVIGKNLLSDTNYFSGNLQELRFWNTGLDSAIISDWSYRTLDSSHSMWNNLVAYYPLTEQILDSSTIQEAKVGTNNAESHNVTTAVELNKSQFASTELTITKKPKDYWVNNLIGSCFNNKFYLFYAGWSDMYTDLIGLKNMTGQLTEDNKIKNTNDIKMPDDALPGAGCVYKNNLYMFGFLTISGNDAPLAYYKLSDEGKWSKRINFHNTIFTGIKPDVQIIGDSMYVFYVDDNRNLMEIHTGNGNDYTSPKILLSNRINKKDGSFTVCSGKDRQGFEVVYIACITNDEQQIQLYRYDGNKMESELLFPAPDVKYVDMIQGSISSNNLGYMLQIFYSVSGKNNKTIYGSPYGLCRLEYNINGFLSDKEYFQTNTLYSPSVFKYYTESGSDTKTKIVLVNYHYGKINFIIWKSDKLRYRSDLIGEFELDDLVFGKLNGVIEGPPPYVLNGQEFDQSEPPSYIEIGKSNSTSNEKSVSADWDFDVSARIFGFGGQFHSETQKRLDTAIEIKNSMYHKLVPSLGDHSIGSKVISAPVLKMHAYDILDDNDNVISAIRLYSLSKMIDKYRPYFLDTARKAPNPFDFVSYMNRNIDFSKFDKHYTHDFTWQANGESKYQFEQCETYTDNTSWKYGGGWGITIDVGVGVEEGIAAGIEASVSVHYNAFNLDMEMNWYSETEATNSMTNTDEIEIAFSSPGGSNNGDTNYFSGTVYWLKYTDGQDNWWCPEEHKRDKPWCITYAIKEFEITKGVILSSGNELTGKNEVCVYPNPSADFVNISFNTSARAETRCKIYDILGKPIKTLLDNTLNEGPYNLKWDCKDNNGKLVPSGTYICILDVNGELQTHKFNIIK